MKRLALVATIFSAACAHSPPPTASYTVDAWRSDRQIFSFRALGGYEISGGMSVIFWYAQSDAPVLKSGLVVAGLEFTASSNPEGAFVMPFALVGTADERRHRNALRRDKEDAFLVALGDSVVVSHFRDGTELPFPLEFTVRSSGDKPEEIR